MSKIWLKWHLTKFNLLIVQHNFSLISCKISYYGKHKEARWLNTYKKKLHIFYPVKKMSVLNNKNVLGTYVYHSQYFTQLKKNYFY